MIAILLNDTLQAIAIKKLAGHIAAEAVIARDLDDLTSRLAPHARLIITDAVHFVAQLHWFMPRRDHVVIADAFPASTPSDEPDQPPCERPGQGQALQSGGERPGPAWLPLPCSQTELLRCLADIVNSTMGDRQPQAPPPDVLTRRERDVLRLIAAGERNTDIAERLHISLNTVLSHRKHITAKLGLKSIAQLSRYALLNALI